MEIRLAREDDLQEIIKLCNEVKIKLLEDKIYMWDEEYPNYDIFMDDISNKRMFVAIIEEKVVGTISYNHDLYGEYLFDMPISVQKKRIKELEELCGKEEEKICSLHRLMVSPLYRNQHIATLLLKQVEEEVKNETIILITDINNNIARRLYLKNKYSFQGIYSFTFGNMALYIKNLTYNKA